MPFGGANNNMPLYFALVNPKFEAPTKKMRAVLPQEVRMGCMTASNKQQQSGLDD